MQEISYLKISSIAIVSLLTALFVTFQTRKYAIAHKIGVYPNERMVHKGFIPQLGGLGIFFGFLTGTILSIILFSLNINNASDYFYILIGSAIIVLIGVYDDLKGLNAPRKFIGQFLAASVLIAAGCRIDILKGKHHQAYDCKSEDPG